MDNVAKITRNFAAYYNDKNITLIRKKFADIMFKRQEETVSHNTIQWEENAFEAVKSGKEAIRYFLEQEYDGEIGVLSEDSLRNIKNNCIATISVLTRQILGEQLLDLENALSMSDACILCIEDCANEIEAIQVTIAGMVEFSSMIELKPKTEYHHFIRKTKEYIFKHLHEKIEVRSIARKLKTNPDYLSRVFHKYEGVTLHRFIIDKKIDSAKNMLQYTKYSNDEIGNYLGFASQSHLQTLFKKATGLTLSQYRLNHNERYRDRF